MSRRSAVISFFVAACLLVSGLFATHAEADDSSLNWAGYYALAAPGQKITQVSGTTYVPVYRNLPPTLAVSWVGIGGATGTDLIQAGLAMGKLEGYYIWFERLPEPIQPVRSGCIGDNTCKVVPGDRIDMDIRNTGGDQWKITLVNVGKWWWTFDTAYKSSFSSAEWIYEAPSYGLAGVPVGVYTIPANIPHARFFNNRYVINGQAKMLKQNEANRTHVGLLANVSTTSDVRGDSAFQVCPYRQRCAKP